MTLFCSQHLAEYQKAVKIPGVSMTVAPIWIIVGIKNSVCDENGTFKDRVKVIPPKISAVFIKNLLRYLTEKILLLNTTNFRGDYQPLQHETTTQCIGLSPACARSHHPSGPKASHALTFKLDHSGGAAQIHLPA